MPQSKACYAIAFNIVWLSVARPKKQCLKPIPDLLGSRTVLFILKVTTRVNDTWKLYLFLEHQYQPVSSFLITAAILVYPYLQLKYFAIRHLQSK